MLEARHLRLGNKIFGIGGIQTVFEILDNTDRGKYDQRGYEHLILVVENKNQYKPIEIEPIPLTVELLKTIGFTEHQNNGFKSYENGFMSVSKYDSGFYFYTTNVKHLHDLQNLHFAISYNELSMPSNEVLKTNGAAKELFEKLQKQWKESSIELPNEEL